MDAAATPALLTTSRPRDLILFFSVLVLMLALSPRLRVYHRVTVADVSVERVEPDGRSSALPTPAAFVRPGNGYWGGNVLVGYLEPRIREFMRVSEWNRDAIAGTRFVWTIRWSDESTALDHTAHVMWEVPHGDAGH